MNEYLTVEEAMKQVEEARNPTTNNEMRKAAMAKLKQAAGMSQPKVNNG